jgi:DNA-binding transcriptional LysR family regulator
MDLRQLSTFRVVAEKLNFTRAAEQLHLAQSSVSAQIRSLERELGVMLFDRIGKQVHLTDAGKKLYGYARRIQGMTDEIRSEVAAKQYLHGTLTIRMPESLAAAYMPEVIIRYNRKYPDVRLNFINCSDLELARELNTGHIDIALLMTDDMTMRDVTLRYLKTEQLKLCCSPSHPLTTKQRITPTDLQGRQLLLPKTD